MLGNKVLKIGSAQAIFEFLSIRMLYQGYSVITIEFARKHQDQKTVKISP